MKVDLTREELRWLRGAIDIGMYELAGDFELEDTAWRKHFKFLKKLLKKIDKAGGWGREKEGDKK